MKKIFSILVVVSVALATPALSAQTTTPISDRPISIPFSASLVDGAGLAYDGTVDVEAWFYKAATHETADLIYAESFSGANVDHGLFRVALLTGTPEGGTIFSPAAFASHEELFVDIKVDGATMLELAPLRPWFAAVRAEHADRAEGLRTDLKLDIDDIPAHSASVITTGTFNEDRIPAFPATKITTGTFDMGQIPTFPADRVLGGAFSSDAMPSSLSADNFPDDGLSDSVISDDVLRDDDIGFGFGPVGHNGSVPVPDGFSRSQCQWVLSLRHIDGFGGVDQYHITTGTGGEVQCRWSPNEDGSNENYCTASYLIICKK